MPWLRQPLMRCPIAFASSELTQSRLTGHTERLGDLGPVPALPHRLFDGGVLHLVDQAPQGDDGRQRVREFVGDWYLPEVGDPNDEVGHAVEDYGALKVR